jgi:hypothetical protein
MQLLHAASRRCSGGTNVDARIGIPRRWPYGELGTGDFGTSPIFGQLSDKQLLVMGRRNAKHNGETEKSPIYEDDFEAPASITGRLSSDSYSSPLVLNRRINVESVMFRFLFLIESLRFFSGLFV